MAASQHGLFAVAQALRAGYSEREIKLHSRSDWNRLRRGIYIERQLLPVDDISLHVLNARAALFRVTDGAVASHVSAAAIHGFALLEPDLSTVHITRVGLKASRTEAGVHHHAVRVAPGKTLNVDDIAVTDAAWTVVDAARESSLEQGLVLAESALWREDTTPAALREVLFTCRDWPGSRTAGRVVSFASTGSESPGESLARLAFDRLGLPQPRQQVAVRDAHGLIGYVDFLWDDFRTIGEFDGRLKYEVAPPAVLYAEKVREDRLREAGFEVVRFGWADVRGGAEELGRRVRAASARAARRRAVGA